MKSDKIYFDNLDSIRFIAATMVFLGHAFGSFYETLPDNTLKNILNLISSGASGVSIFFVLSGFLITYLLISEFNLNSKINIKHFYMRRVLRIWPLYFSVTAIALIIYPFPNNLIGIGERILYNVSFLSNFIKCYFSGEMMPEGVTWSVSVEEQFYLIWPLIFTFIPNRFWLGFIGLTIFVSVFFRIVNFDNNTILYFHSLSVLVDLAMGGLFAYLVMKYAKIKRFFENSSTIFHTISFLFSFCLLYWNVKIFYFEYGYAIGRLFISASFGFIICSQALTKSNSILNLKHFSFASKWGKYTYGIYLIHPIALLIIGLIATQINFAKEGLLNTLIIGLCGFILTLVISKLSYIYFESVFLKLKDKFTIIKTYK